MRPGRHPSAHDAFDQLQASMLLCPRCRVARPVRERLLLVLPDGELHEYLCTACGTSAGTRKVSGAPPVVFAGQGRSAE